MAEAEKNRDDFRMNVLGDYIKKANADYVKDLPDTINGLTVEEIEEKNFSRILDTIRGMKRENSVLENVLKERARSFFESQMRIAVSAQKRNEIEETLRKANESIEEYIKALTLKQVRELIKK